MKINKINEQNFLIQNFLKRIMRLDLTIKLQVLNYCVLPAGIKLVS